MFNTFINITNTFTDTVYNQDLLSFLVPVWAARLKHMNTHNAHVYVPRAHIA